MSKQPRTLRKFVAWRKWKNNGQRDYLARYCARGDTSLLRKKIKTQKGEKCMKDYQQPVVEVITFATADVLTLSDDKADGDLDWE